MAKKVSITKASYSEASALAAASAQKEYMQMGLARMATALSSPLPPDAVGRVLKDIRTYNTTLDNMEKIAKAGLVAYLKQAGAVVEGTKTLATNVAGVKLAMHPTRAGVDPKKLEAALRSRGFDPARYMATKVTYEVGDETVGKLLGAGVFTEDELKTLEYAESWTLKTPEIGRTEETESASE